MWRKINDLRGTVNSWHAESGGVISLITLSLPSLTGVFGKKKIQLNGKVCAELRSICTFTCMQVNVRLSHMHLRFYSLRCPLLTAVQGTE